MSEKREFMKQYVLNRALTVDNLDGEGCAKAADQAWKMIERCAPPHPSESEKVK